MMTKEEIEQALSMALISVGVAAAILAISKIQVYELIHGGRLEAINVGMGRKPAFRVKSDSVRRIFEEVYAG